MFRARHTPGILRPVVSTLADAVFPPLCMACDRSAGGGGGGGVICPACEGQLRRSAALPSCPLCGALLAQAGDGCQRCHNKGLPHLDGVLRLAVYDGALREMVLRMKFARAWWLADYLCRELREAAGVAELLQSADVVTPVPLHWWRHVTRGYNQAEELARRLARSPGVSPFRGRVRGKYGRLLARSRSTPPQSRQTTATARERNVAGAFHPVWGCPDLSGKTVVLVDDVLTTGATLCAAAGALRSRGASHVWGLVVGVPDRRELPES